MKRIIISASSILFGVFFLNSCNNVESDTDLSNVDSVAVINPADTIKPIVLENKGLILTEVVGSPVFDDAKLILKSPKMNEALVAREVKFEFSILGKSYHLGNASKDAATKSCANSDKGQHIHVIVDNKPYEATYDTNYTLKETLNKGNHVALTFLSRSYHESVKSKDAYQLTQFRIGDQDMDDIDLKAPHLFYSRPKGDYKGEDVNQVMLDFYLVNTIIGENGNYVMATFNDSTEFKITKWAPYLVKGLPLGLNKLELKLMDASGKVIPGPYNAVVREFNLIQQ
jgi:hypothetical protein